MKQGLSVTVKWIDFSEKERPAATATVVTMFGTDTVVLAFDHEPDEEYQFERNGTDLAHWYEINNSSERVAITEARPDRRYDKLCESYGGQTVDFAQVLLEQAQDIQNEGDPAIFEQVGTELRDDGHGLNFLVKFGQDGWRRIIITSA